MATETKNFQIIQKTGAEDFLVVHPETTDENVLISAEGIEADNLKEALVELKGQIDDAVAGGVTSVNGQTGAVTVDKKSLGLENVDNTADLKKPISEATQAALDLKADKSEVETELSKKVGQSEVDAAVEGKADKSYVDTELAKKQAAGDYATKTEVTQEIKEAIDAVVGEDVDEAFDTLKEIADWIKNDETGTSALTNRVGALETNDKKQDTDIAAAKSAADNAQTDATKGISDAAAAKSAADNAQKDATKALSDAASADAKAGEAKTAADGAQETADANATEISNIKDGTTKVGAATKADSATSADNASTADKLKTPHTVSLIGDATGSASFDGSADAPITVVLSNTGVKAGSYSAVTVDTKGRVTAGAQLIEIGEAGQETPSANLAIGGLFLKNLG